MSRELEVQRSRTVLCKVKLQSGCTASPYRNICHPLYAGACSHARRVDGVAP